MNEELIRKEDGYYDRYGNWFSKRLIEGGEYHDDF